MYANKMNTLEIKQFTILNKKKILVHNNNNKNSKFLLKIIKFIWVTNILFILRFDYQSMTIPDSQDKKYPFPNLQISY